MHHFDNEYHSALCLTASGSTLAPRKVFFAAHRPRQPGSRCSSATLRMPRAPCRQKRSISFAACGQQTNLICRGGRSSLRHYDFHTFQVRRLCRFLETASLFPPLAVLHRFPCASAALRGVRHGECRALQLPQNRASHDFEYFKNEICLILRTAPPCSTGRSPW